MDSTRYSALPGRKFDAVVYPAAGPFAGEVVAQPSKNYTTRYLLAAALARGESLVHNCATSADAAALKKCLRQLGAVVRDEAGTGGGVDVKINGVDGRPDLEAGDVINPGNAGAVLRFLIAVGALLPEVTFDTDHKESLGKRPNGDLLEALKQLGCSVESNDGRLPITLRGGKLHGGVVQISGAKSSQFLSGLLFLSPLVGEPLHIDVTGGLVSNAPVMQTLEVLRTAGVQVDASPDLLSFDVKPTAYRGGKYTVNGDWPGSAALLAAAAVTGGPVVLRHLYNDQQGEKESASVLRQMGAHVEFSAEGDAVTISRSTPLHAVEFDGDLATDAVLALMGAAAFAEGRTRFYNVSNLRLKECDRISEPIAELRKLGVKCWEGNELGDADPDAIIIEGDPQGYAGGVTVDGRNDHRVIMLLSIIALGCRQPVRILRAHEVSKSYPDYFAHFVQLGGRVDFVECEQ